MIIKIDESKEVTGRFTRMERYEMRSEDGFNNVQSSIIYHFGETKKGEFAKCRFGDLLIQGNDYAYFMLLNTIPENVYSVILELDPKLENYEEISNAALKLGFVLQKQKLNAKVVTMVKKIK